MSHRKFFIGVTAVLLLLSVSARSQEPLRGADENAAAAVRKKSLDLLTTLAGQVESLRSAENRARIRSNIAELLWKDDETRSRSLFALVEEDIKAGYADTDSEDPRYHHTLKVFAQLRRDTLDRIAKHDPESALAFLRTTRFPSHIQLPYEMKDGDKALELRLARQVAAKNPQLALKLGRQSLAKGFSPDLVLVLSQLQRKDKDAALSFYKEILEKLKTVNLGLDPTATHIAVSLARSFSVPQPEEGVYRDLLAMLLAAALADGCADEHDESPQICFDIAPVVSRIAKYFPERAEPLRRWSQLRGHEGPPPEVWEEITQIIREGSVNDILAVSGKYPEMQRQLHWAAARKAGDLGDLAKARQIAAEFPDEEQRRYMLEQIDRDQMRRSANAEKLAAIQQQLGRLRNNYERINFLLATAAQIGGNDRKAALALLNQSGQIIASSKPGKNLLEAQIGLAIMYSSLKSDRGFTIMESVMPKLNELVTAAIALDGFENSYLRDGEWNMTGEGALGGMLTRLVQNAGPFAWLDFDRAVNLAGQLERPELRLMAQLKIAQSILENQPNIVVMYQRGDGFH